MGSSRWQQRRLAAKQSEVTQQMIVFNLRQELFCLPAISVQKVVFLGEVYGDPNDTGVSLTIYQNKEVLVIDVAKRIFQETQVGSLHNTTNIQSDQRYLLILPNHQKELFGLPIDSQPYLRRIPKSAFVPLPDNYLSQGNIGCVSSLMIQSDSEAPIFVLSPEMLVVSS